LSPGFARFLIIVSLSLLPLQSANAFFCFNFFMGGKSGNHAPGHLRYSPRRYNTPPPSWYLSRQRYLPYPAYPQTPLTQPATTPDRPAGAIPTH